MSELKQRERKSNIIQFFLCLENLIQMYNILSMSVCNYSNNIDNKQNPRNP